MHDALAREIREETGWLLRGIGQQVADWEWEFDGVIRRELDYLVEVDGDLTVVKLEDGKHDRYAWIGLDNLHVMTEGRSDGDCRLRDIIAQRSIRVLAGRITRRGMTRPVHSGSHGPAKAGHYVLLSCLTAGDRVIVAAARSRAEAADADCRSAREACGHQRPGRSAKSVSSRRAVCSGIAARSGRGASDSRCSNGHPIARDGRSSTLGNSPAEAGHYATCSSRSAWGTGDSAPASREASGGRAR